MFIVEEANLCPEVEDSLTASQTFNKPTLRPPLPPPKRPSVSPSPPPMIEEVFYEDPQVFMNKAPPTKFEDSFEEVYDNIDEANAIRDLNKFPPPVWKQDEGLQPPPLPPSHPVRRYTRSFNQSSEFVQVDEWRAAAAAATTKMPKQGVHSNKPTVDSPAQKHKKHFGSLKNSPRTPKHKVKTKPPAPPAKPWKSGSSDDLLNTNSSELLGGGRSGHGTATGTRGVGFNLKNDPKFGKKLQEKRQELYGDTPAEKNRPRSWGHDQEAYEEVPFTASDDSLLNDRAMQGNCAGPINSSDDEYVDCQPHEDDDSPAAYLEHISPERRAAGKGPNTLKREEFLRRPPLPLPSHSSAGNPIHQSPPKIPASSSDGGGRPPVFVRPPVASSAGTNAPPAIPRRGNERPPMPLPGAVVDGISDDDDEAPPVPRRHPHASDKHRAAVAGDSNPPSSSSRGRSPPDNAIPLPPRSLPLSSPPYPSSPISGDNAPPLPQRGPRQFDSSPSSSVAVTNQSKKPKPPPKQRSISPDSLSSPASAKSDHVFEPFTFGQGPPSVPNTLPQTAKKSNRAAKPLVPTKNQASTLGGGTRPSYETKLPADIGMKTSKKKFIESYETNLPASIGNRPPLHNIKRPAETATPSSSSSSSSSATTKPRPPIKPPVAAKPAIQPKSPPHLPVKPQVSKKPGTGQYPTSHPKPPALTPKPAVGTTNLASSRTNFTNSTSLGRSFNSSSSGDSYNSQLPSGSSRAVRTRNGASKPPAPPGKPKPLLPPTVDRRKPLPTPSC